MLLTTSFYHYSSQWSTSSSGCFHKCDFINWRLQAELLKRSRVTDPQCSSTLHDVNPFKANERQKRWNPKHTPVSVAFCGLLHWAASLWFEFSAYYSLQYFPSVSRCLLKKTKNKIRIGFKHMCKISHFYLFFKSQFPGSPSSLLPLLASSVSSLLNFGGLFFFSSYQIFRQSSSVRKKRYKSTKCKLKKHERERYLRHMNPN